MSHRRQLNYAGKSQPRLIKHYSTTEDRRIFTPQTRWEQNGSNPLPSGFRHICASLVRCLYRAAFPALPISQYPHGLFNPAVPLSLNLSLPDKFEAVKIITDFAEGNSDALMALLEVQSPAPSALEHEYWLEELERLRRYFRCARNSTRLD